MAFDEEHLDPHGECAHEIMRLQKELAVEREKFLMHTAEVSAWLSVLGDVFGVKAETVRDSCSQIFDAAKAMRAANAELERMISPRAALEQ